MKVRNGFVSNSSSSSFVIIYKDVPKEELKAGHYMIGDYLSEGYDYIRLEDWMIELINSDKFTTIDSVEFIDELASGEDEIVFDGDKARLLSLVFSGATVKAKALTIDHNGSSDRKDFKSRYIKDK